MGNTSMAAYELGIRDRSDTIHEALWDREGDRRTPSCVLAAEEVWDYDAVTEGWREHLRDRLAVHGIRYDLDEDEAALPATIGLDEARRICSEEQDDLMVWIDTVVSQTRAGKPAPCWDVRSDTDPGARWVQMAKD
jgi:hypothetical protein